MIVKFPSAVKGDTAYVEIKKKLADMEDIKVYHPLKDSLGTYRAGKYLSLTWITELLLVQSGKNMLLPVGLL